MAAAMDVLDLSPKKIGAMRDAVKSLDQAWAGNGSPIRQTASRSRLYRAPTPAKSGGQSKALASSPCHWNLRSPRSNAPIFLEAPESLLSPQDLARFFGEAAPQRVVELFRQLSNCIWPLRCANSPAARRSREFSHGEEHPIVDRRSSHNERPASVAQYQHGT
jgi:hypothetical protein